MSTATKRNQKTSSTKRTAAYFAAEILDSTTNRTGAAAVFYKYKYQPHSFQRELEVSTIEEAEYCAAIIALQKCLKLNSTDVVLIGDSELIFDEAQKSVESINKSRTSGGALDFETRNDELAELDVQFKMIVKLFKKLEVRLIKAEDNLIAHDCLKEIPNKFKSLSTGHNPLEIPYLKSVATVARTSFAFDDEDDSAEAEE